MLAAMSASITSGATPAALSLANELVGAAGASCGGTSCGGGSGGGVVSAAWDIAAHLCPTEPVRPVGRCDSPRRRVSGAALDERTHAVNATGHETASTHSTEDDVAELAERIKGIRFAMVTLPDAVGDLHGRPLTVQDVDFDGTLWFMVSRSAEWTSAAGSPIAANAAFNDADDGRWVSVSGSARLVDDRDRVKEMWSPLYGAWFDGADDPDAVLLRFDAHSADYWDADANRIVRLARLVKAAVTGGSDDDTGERGTLRTG